MKLLLALILLCRCGAGFSSRAVTNPVSRVVQLLTSLSQKLELELKEDTNLFKRYECWKKSVVAAKAASNALATSRIDSLTTYVADIDAGRITFTTEQADLEKSIASLQADLQQAAALRAQENGDFLAAKAEMEQAGAGLTEAIRVLKDGTAAPTLLISKSKRVHNADIRENLQRAVQISRQVLSASDAKLLIGMLKNADVPTWDWKKLNRKATYKSKYKASSGNIIDTLESLQTTFSSHLADAIAKEGEDVLAYGKLKGGKDSMLAASQKSLVDMVEETGAKGLSKSEAAAEISDLQKQVLADTAFSNQAEASYVLKSAEFDARKTLRVNEITACSKAVAVLHSDDARDLFKASYKSQGYSLLQDTSSVTSSSQLQCRNRVESLLQLARAVKDPRAALLAIAARQGSIASVITKVDGLIATLDAEEASDLAQKETCETDIAAAAQDAKMASLAIDDFSEEITRANSKAAEIQTQIEEEQANVITTQEELLTLTNQRADEKRKYGADKLQDQGAVQLLDLALAIMAKFKQGGGAAASSSFLQLTQNVQRNSSLVAVQKHVASQHTDIGAHAKHFLAVEKQPIEVEAGLAPPPPPATWVDPTYAGAEGESTGIFNLLTLIKLDVEKDITLGDSAEAAAVLSFAAQDKSLKASILAANNAIMQYTGDKSVQEKVAIGKGTERASKKLELDGSIKLFQGLKPGCDYVAVNFEIRRTKRQVETDGLKEAKAILQGADFSLLQSNGTVDC